MGKTLQILVSWLMLMLTLSVEPVAAWGIYYGNWYIYVIVVFVVIAISSCIGACVRHKRNQLYIQQQQALASGGINITTASTQAYYPSSYGQNTPYPQPPPGGFVQHPPAYGSQGATTAEKDPNMPPAYDEAVNAPSYPTAGAAPYPTQPSPYPIQQQTAPYPTQPAAPYPTQPTAPGAPPS